MTQTATDGAAINFGGGGTVAYAIGGGQPLTKVDDTNVTLTLGGTPATSLLQSVSLTLGWAGTLANARLATMATNTIKGNATSGTASPTDLAIGTCSTTASALIWTTNTGFGCNTAIVAASAATATTATTATNATNTAITDDSATNATMYPTWVTATSGNLPQKISSTKMTFNPASAALTIGGNMAANSFNNIIVPNPGATASFTLGSGKAVAISNSLTFSGTDSTTMTFPTTSATLARTDAGQTFTGTNVFGTISPTTINAFTLGGTISGGGNQINNAIIGTTTPLAGSFTTVIASTSVTSPLYYGGSSAGSTATINGTSNGSPSSAFLLLQSNGQNVGIGNTSPKTYLDLNTNLSSSPALVVSTSLVRWQSPDGTNGGSEWVSYGTATQNVLTGAVAGGTAASPTGTPTGRSMFNLRGYGWNATSWQIGGIITIRSGDSATWSGTNQGTQIDFYTTPNSTTALALAGQFFPSGGFGVGSSSDPGIGKVSATNGFVANALAGITTVCTIAVGNVLTFTLGILTAKGGVAGCT
jgi:hypothetical protein